MRISGGPVRAPARSAPAPIDSSKRNPERNGRWIEADIAEFFRRVRQSLGLPRESIAYRLGIDEHTLAALETGRLDLLPAWPELERFVPAYVQTVGLAPAPIMAMLRNGLEASGIACSASPAASRLAQDMGAHSGLAEARTRRPRQQSGAAQARHRQAILGARIGLVTICVLSGLAVITPWPRLIVQMLP